MPQIIDLKGYIWTAQLSLDTESLASTFNLNFTTKIDLETKTYTSLTADASGLTYGSTLVYDKEANQWLDDDYRIIQITGGTDSNINSNKFASLLTWLQLATNGAISKPFLYDLKKLDLEPGTHAIRLIATADDYANSEPSTPAISVNVYKVNVIASNAGLDPIVTKIYDNDTLSVLIQANENYELPDTLTTPDGVTYYKDPQRRDQARLGLDGQEFTGDIELQIQASYIQDQLPKPVLRYSYDSVGRKILWDYDQRASYYEVMVDTHTYLARDGSYSLAGLELGKKYEIKVRAVGTGIYVTSDWSEIYTYNARYVLDPPTDLTIDDMILEASPAANADYYRIYTDINDPPHDAYTAGEYRPTDGTIHIDLNDYDMFGSTMVWPGTHKVYLVSVSDNRDVWEESELSDYVEIDIPLWRLSVPVISSESTDLVIQNPWYDNTFEYEIHGECGLYTFAFRIPRDRAITKCPWSKIASYMEIGGVYSIFVYACPSQADTNVKYEPYSNASNIVRYTQHLKLATPVMSVSNDALRWIEDPNAGYYKIWVDSMESLAVIPDTNPYPISNLALESGPHKFYMQAISENEYYSDSDIPDPYPYTSVTPKLSLSEYTWEEIDILGEAVLQGFIKPDQLNDIYHISATSGATKNATINGEIHPFRLIGIMTDLTPSDELTAFTFEQADLTTARFAMKDTMSDSDSFANSDLFASLNAMTIEEDLDAVIKQVKKPCCTSVTSGGITNVTAKLWILSENEIAASTSVVYNKTVEGTPYSYYYAQGYSKESRIKTSRDGNAYDYWLRSPHAWVNFLGVRYSQFVVQHKKGRVTFEISDETRTISICFCI